MILILIRQPPRPCELAPPPPSGCRCSPNCRVKEAGCFHLVLQVNASGQFECSDILYEVYQYFSHINSTSMGPPRRAQKQRDAATDRHRPVARQEYRRPQPSAAQAPAGGCLTSTGPGASTGWPSKDTVAHQAGLRHRGPCNSMLGSDPVEDLLCCSIMEHNNDCCACTAVREVIDCPLLACARRLAAPRGPA